MKAARRTKARRSAAALFDTVLADRRAEPRLPRWRVHSVAWLFALGLHVALWAAANRDPAEFSTPDDVDLERRISTGHISFGRGIHFCVGAPLARLEARAAVSALLRGTPSFTLDPDDPPARVTSIFVRRHARLPLVVQP